MIRVPVNLHISHSWGGGIHRWVHDFCTFDTNAENLVLESVGTRECFGIGHQLLEGDTRRELQRWVLRDPISETRVNHREYRERIETICREFHVTHIMLSCMVGHALDFFDFDLPITKIHHDFYPYCPNIYTYFDRPCAGCTHDEFEVCLRENPVDFANGKSSVQYWLDYREAYLEAIGRPHVMHVCPSESVRTNLATMNARFEDLTLHVIPHGINMEQENSFGGAEDGRNLRVAVLGTQHIVKGLKVLEAAFDRARLIADFTFLGGGPEGTPFMDRFGVRYIERYDHADLSGLLRDGAFDLALFTSTFPETFCYTLSEVRAHAIPPCARQVGSFVDRITDGENGFLIGPGSEDIVDFLIRAHRDRSLLRALSERLSQEPLRTVETMIQDYERLRHAATSGAKSRPTGAFTAKHPPKPTTRTNP